MSSDPFDIFEPAFAQNPYPSYAWLREHDPIHWGISADIGESGMWHVSRHADILRVLRDPRFLHRGRPEVGDLSPQGALFLELAGQSLLFVNPPAHTRLRGLVSRAFTPRAVEDLRPQIVTTADTLLDRAADADAFDVIADYALPLTVTIISSMLGIPEEARTDVSRWAGALVRAVDCKQSTEAVVSAGETALEIYQFFLSVIERLRAAPDATILSGLIQAHDADDRLSEAEIIVTATTLLMAGHETTVNLIGSGTLALLRHPDQLALLRAQPGVIPSAVEECLRYDAPSQMTSRVASEDIPLGGVTIRQGQVVNLLTGSGNRDPEAFTAPDQLDITRQENRHLSFGMGIHYCLGAPLARLEGQIALPTLLRRFPRLALADEEIVWRDTIGFRGLRGLRVTAGM
jgi:cytochrome P450